MASQKKTQGAPNKKIDDFFTSAHKRLEASSPISSELTKCLKKVRLAATPPKKHGLFKMYF